METPGAFRTLTRAECLHLLESAEIGRVVLTDGGLPTALPVTFTLDGDAIAFRTTPGGKLAAASRGAVVAFEVDSLDPATRSGWSVVVTGVAHEVTNGADVMRLEQTGLVSWLPDQPEHWIRITPDVVSGRVLGPVVSEAAS